MKLGKKSIAIVITMPIAFIFTTTLSGWVYFAHASSSVCVDAVNARLTTSSPLNVASVIKSADPAAELIRQLHQDSDIPTFVRNGALNSFPVIHMTPDTRMKLAGLLDRSMGYIVQQNHTERYDHGLVRVRDYIIDMDLPGQRTFGEIHGTGISWKPLESYVNRRNAAGDKQPDTLIEIAFLPTEEELQSIEYYFRLLRSTVFRFPFNFGGAVNDLSRPNTLKECGGHCFVFSKGVNVTTISKAVIQRLRDLGADDPLDAMQSPQMTRFLNHARKTVLEADENDAKIFGWDIGHKGVNLQFLREILPLTKTDEDLKIAANWFMTLHASIAYEAFRKRHYVDGNFQMNEVNTARPLAALIYDKPSRTGNFRSAKYNSQGLLTAWTNENQLPLAESSTVKPTFNTNRHLPLKAEEIFSMTAGDPKNPPVVLIHGLGSSHETYSDIVPVLAKTHYVISYDLRGHGQTRALGENYSTEAMADDLLTVLRKHQISRAHLIGHSIGARVMLKFAHLYPERTISLVSEDMQAAPVEHLTQEKFEKHLFFARAYNLLDSRYNSIEDASRVLLDYFKGDAEKARRAAAKYAHFETISGEVEFNRPAVEQMLGYQGNVDDFGATLQRLQQPILFLRADPERSPFFPDSGVSHVLKHGRNAFIKNVPFAGHTIHRGIAKEEYLNLVKQFLTNGKITN